MIIFVRNISPKTTKLELKQFAEAPLKSWIPFRVGKVNRVEILTFKDMRTKITEYHGLIYVDDRNGRILLKKLNRTKLVNKYVNVREYKNRSTKNDRRMRLGFKDDSGNRISDRRRGDLLTAIEYNIRIVALSSSHRNI